MSVEFGKNYVFAEEKIGKGKGGGYLAAIKMLSDVLAFQDKLSTCIEAQDLAENKQKLTEYSKQVSSLYKTLVNIADTAMPGTGTREPVAENPVAENPIEDKSETMVNAPTVPSLSKLNM